MSNNGFKAKAIIRTGVGSERPLNPQHQHIGDFTDAFQLILKNTDIVRLEEPEQIVSAYQEAYEKDGWIKDSSPFSKKPGKGSTEGFQTKVV